MFGAVSERQVQELYSLLEVSRVIGSSLRLDRVLETVVEQGMRVVGAEAGTVWLVEGGGERVVPMVALGPRAEEVKKLWLRPGEGIAGATIARRKGILVEDVRRDPNWAARFDSTSGFVTRSMMCVPLLYKDEAIGALQFINKRHGRLFGPGDLGLAQALASQAAVAIQNSRLYEERRTMLLSLIRSLTATLDARDPYTAGHSERVTRYSLMIAEELGMPEEFREALEWGGLLHDIGKIGIRDNILLKQERLTLEEVGKLKEHPAIGANIIDMMEPKHLLHDAKMVARHHQEKWDGSGYPDGLKGEEIPPAARMVAIADAFDAMTTDRPYSKGRPFEVALAEIERCAGTHFDPVFAHAFVRAMRRHLERNGAAGPVPLVR